MAIELAEPVDPLAIAEVGHLVRDSNPHTVEQIARLLEDPVTVERMAKHHSSLLVRMLAERLMKNWKPGGKRK